MAAILLTSEARNRMVRIQILLYQQGPGFKSVKKAKTKKKAK